MIPRRSAFCSSSSGYETGKRQKRRNKRKAPGSKFALTWMGRARLGGGGGGPSFKGGKDRGARCIRFLCAADLRSRDVGGGKVFVRKEEKDTRKYKKEGRVDLFLSSGAFAVRSVKKRSGQGLFPAKARGWDRAWVIGDVAKGADVLRR